MRRRRRRRRWVDPAPPTDPTPAPTPTPTPHRPQRRHPHRPDASADPDADRASIRPSISDRTSASLPARLRRMQDGATGQGVKMAVIDSGINPDARRICGPDRPGQPRRRRQPRRQRRRRPWHGGQPRSPPPPATTPERSASPSTRRSCRFRADAPGIVRQQGRLRFLRQRDRAGHRCGAAGRRQGHQHVARRIGARTASCCRRSSAR